MSKEPDTLKIEMEATGEVFEIAEEFSITDSFTIASDLWTATIYDNNDPASLRKIFLPKSRVRLYIGENLQMIGRIERTEGAGKGSRGLKLRGQDYFADLVSPSMDEAVAITTNMTIADALLAGLRVFGISEIETSLDEVLSKKMGKTRYAETKKEQPLVSYRAALEPDTQAFADALPVDVIRTPVIDKVADAKPRQEGALAWGQRLVSRFGYTLQPGSKRSAVAVVVPDFSQSIAYQINSGENNLEESKAIRDWASVPTIAAARSKQVTQKRGANGAQQLLSPVEKDSDLSFGSIDEVQRIYANAEAVPGRIKRTEQGNPNSWYCPIYHRDDDAKTPEQLKKSTRRLISDQLRDTMKYTCRISGHRDQTTGLIYSTNALAAVSDDEEDVHETLWTYERTIGHSNGDFTELTMIRPSTFQL